MAMPYGGGMGGGGDFDMGMIGGGGAGGGYLHDGLGAGHGAGHVSDVSGINASELYSASPPKVGEARPPSGGKLPPVSKAQVMAGKDGAKGGPRAGRFKEAAGAPGGPPPAAPRGGGKAGVDKRDDIKSARQKEVQAKAAERRGRR